jgi:hypothetical protein
LSDKPSEAENPVVVADVVTSPELGEHISIISLVYELSTRELGPVTRVIIKEHVNLASRHLSLWWLDAAVLYVFRVTFKSHHQHHKGAQKLSIKLAWWRQDGKWSCSLRNDTGSP